MDVSMQGLIVALTAPEAADADCVGPKAAHLAALAGAGVPTPGGFCLGAAAYRLQCERLGLQPLLDRFAAASPPDQRRLSVEIRLKLYQEPITPEILEPLLAAWREQRHDGSLGVV